VPDVTAASRIAFIRDVVEAGLVVPTGTMPTTPYHRTDIGIISSFCQLATAQPTCRCPQFTLSLACSNAGFLEHTKVPSIAHICRPTLRSTRSVSTAATRAGVVCSSTAYSSRLWSPPRNRTRKSWAKLTTYNYVVAGAAKWRPHLIRIIENNNLAIPAGLEAERLWVINGKDVWTTAFSDES